MFYQTTYQSTSLVIVQIHQFTALLLGELVEALLLLTHIDEWLAEPRPERKRLITRPGEGDYLIKVSSSKFNGQ